MSPHINNNSKFRCPYEGCGKAFEKPTVLIDSSTLPRQTNYCCPHCMSKIEVIAENLKIVGVRPTEYHRVFESPAKCAHYSGLLTQVSKNAQLPDECLLCPKVLQCTIRR